MLEKNNLDALPEDADEAYAAIAAFVKEVMGALQIHSCLVPCCGKPLAGKTGCRFAMPRASGPECESRGPRLFVAHKLVSGGLRIEVLPVGTEPSPRDDAVVGNIVVWELKRPDLRDGRVT